MALRTILFILSLSTLITVYSQNKKEGDTSSRTFFPISSGNKRWKMHFNFDSRRSALLGQKIKINGVRIGANYKGVNRFGIGFYSLKDKIAITDIEVNQPDVHEEPNVRVNFGITTLFLEKVFYKTKYWEVSFPVYLGVGSSNSEYRNNLGNYKLLRKDGFSVIGLGGSTNFYILPWLYPKLTLGYRFAFSPDEKIARSFSKPFYAFGISINPFEAYRSFKKWRTNKKADQSINN